MINVDGKDVNKKNGIKRKGLFSSIRTKMLVYFGLLFIITIALLELTRIYGMPFTGFKGGYVLERAKAFKELDLVADLKKDRLESLLIDIHNDIKVFSGNKLINVTIFELKRKIQENIDNGKSGETLWAEVKKGHSFKDLEQCLLLIESTYDKYIESEVFDLETGTIMASTEDIKIGTDIFRENYKYGDFSRDLLERSFKHGSLNFHAGMHEDEDHLDFDIYAPIRDGNKIIAVLKLDINSNNVILPLLHTGKGLGETGEALLVDHEGRILTPLKHTLPDGTVPELLGFTINTEPELRASRGEEGIIESRDYRGIDVLAAYRSIRVTPEIRWGMVVKKDRSEVFAELDSTMKYSFMMGSVSIFFFGALMIMLIKNITGPVIKLSGIAMEIGKGDLDTELEAGSSDEIGQLTSDFNEMRLKLRESYRGLENKIGEKTNELASALNIAQERNIQLSETRDAMLNLVEDLEVEVTEHKHAEDQVRRQLENLNALRSIDIAISSSLDLDVTLNVLLEQVIARLHADAADVMLLNQDTMTIEHAASKGFRTDAIKQTSMEMGEGFAGYIALEREAINAPDISNISDKCKQEFLLKDEGFKTYFGIPLITKGAVKGVLEIFHRSHFEPDEDWYDFLTALAGQAAIAIDNSIMFDEVQNSHEELLLAYETTIEGWARALDFRDKETEGHSRRVTNMTIRIAREMGIDSSEFAHIRRGALLHDIGKLGVPDNILFKTGELTDKEWELMRRHPLIAYEILAPIPFLRHAIDIPYCHHEKWDGSGYPRGLKGEMIPIAARIFAIVDVWDALISDRPYRPAWSKEAAKEHIHSLAGAHFDPKIVELFIKIKL